MLDPKLQEPLAGLEGLRLAIAHLLIEGYSERQIARRLYVSSSSVKKYVVNLKERMQAKTLHGLSATLMRLYIEQNSEIVFDARYVATKASVRDWARQP